LVNVKWAISSKAFRKPGFPQLDDALRRANVEFFESTYDSTVREYNKIPYDKSDCVVLKGPIQFIRARGNGYFPGAFGFKSDTNTSVYMSILPRNLFFNSDVIYLPFGMLHERKELLHDIFGDSVFVRPDSGFKSFTGFSTTIDKIDYELSSQKQLNNPDAREMCLIAKSKPILGEFRFVICDGEVITGSQYRWDNKLDIRIDVRHDCWTFAETVAKQEWQLDDCYVVDVFLSEDGPKIGEFNSFSSSGLYNCDTDKIVEAVNRVAAKEFKM
jgi:hypothetical protein